MTAAEAPTVLGSGGSQNRRCLVASVAGAGVGVLGDMIGLGGAEFRLPLLIGVFGFLALRAIIVNKALGGLVVATALPARLIARPVAELAPHWSIVVKLLAGSLVGAYLGATWAIKMATRTLYRVLAVLLVLIAVALLSTPLGYVAPADLDGAGQAIAGCSPARRSAPSPRSWASPVASC